MLNDPHTHTYTHQQSATIKLQEALEMSSDYSGGFLSICICLNSSNGIYEIYVVVCISTIFQSSCLKNKRRKNEIYL